MRDRGGAHRAGGLADDEHHADIRPAAQRAPPLPGRGGGAAPEGHGAGGAEAAVAALDEDGVGPAVHAEVARLVGGGERRWRAVV